MKRKFIALFFYVLYLVAIMRPILPILNYYANYDYIVNVLCENRSEPALECNGKCYLKKEIKESVSRDSNETKHQTKLSKIDLNKYPVTFIQLGSCKISSCFIKENKFWPVPNKKPKKVNIPLLRPPSLYI